MNEYEIPMQKTTDKTIGGSKLFAALAKAQGEMTEPKKTAEGYNYNYAPLEEVTKVTRPVLAKHGLSVTQFPINRDERVGVLTVVAHESGESMQEELTMQLREIVSKGNAAQQIGAAITYFRRYSLMAVCGLAPEDDDAMSLEKEVKKFEQKTASKPKAASSSTGNKLFTKGS